MKRVWLLLLVVSLVLMTACSTQNLAGEVYKNPYSAVQYTGSFDVLEQIALLYRPLYVDDVAVDRPYISDFYDDVTANTLLAEQQFLLYKDMLEMYSLFLNQYSHPQLEASYRRYAGGFSGGTNIPNDLGLLRIYFDDLENQCFIDLQQNMIIKDLINQYNFNPTVARGDVFDYDIYLRTYREPMIGDVLVDQMHYTDLTADLAGAGLISPVQRALFDDLYLQLQNKWVATGGIPPTPCGVIITTGNSTNSTNSTNTTLTNITNVTVDIPLHLYNFSLGEFNKTNITTLKSGSLSVGSSNYQYQEVLGFDRYAVSALTAFWEEDYGTSPWVELADAYWQDSTSYRVKFDADIPFSSISTSTPLEVDFAGKDIVIIEATSTGEITLDLGTEVAMQIGDSISIDGRVVTLVNIGSGAVLVNVDGQTKSILVSTTEMFDQANDYEIMLVSINLLGSDAVLKLGHTVFSAESGDALYIFDGETDPDESTWHWDVGYSANGLLYVGAKLGIYHKETDTRGDPDERSALAIGKQLDFPNDYAFFYHAGALDSDMTILEDLEFSFDIVDLDVYSNQKVLTITTANSNDVFEMATSDFASLIWLQKNGNFWYEDGPDEIDTRAKTMKLVLDNEEVLFEYDASASELLLTFENGDEILINIDSGFEHFGTTANQADFDDVTFTVGNNYFYWSGQLYGTTDYDFMGPYGFVVKDLETNLDNDELVIAIPKKQYHTSVIVGTN